MATTINPAVSGVSYRKWLIHVGLYIVGVSAGAFITYAIAHALYSGIAALASPLAWLSVALPLVSLAILRDLGVRVRVPYPERKQVPEWLRRVLPPGLTALTYGGQLGIGFTTRFTYSTHLALVVTLAAVSSMKVVAVAVLVFALAKSIVVITSVGGSSYPEFEQRILKRHRSRVLGQKLLRLTNAALASAASMVLIINV
jgi:hypothetical protein